MDSSSEELLSKGSLGLILKNLNDSSSDSYEPERSANVLGGLNRTNCPLVDGVEET